MDNKFNIQKIKYDNSLPFSYDINKRKTTNNLKK